MARAGAPVIARYEQMVVGAAVQHRRQSGFADKLMVLEWTG
jgi:hypothetical protein